MRNKPYTVVVEVRLFTTYHVSADNAEEAMDKAEDMARQDHGDGFYASVDCNADDE